MKPEELRSRIEGVDVILPTPFKDDYEINEEGLRGNVQFLLDHGIKWFTPCGSIGEFPNLTLAEHRRVIEIVLEETKGKDVLVTPGCGSNSLKVTIELAEWCRRAGCSGVMVPPTTYFKMDVEMAKVYYKAISDAVDIGIIFYLFPDLHRFYINTEELIDLLRSVPNIVAIKDSTLDIIKTERAMRAVGDKVGWIQSGVEFMAAYTYMIGGKAIISWIGNWWPELPLRMHAEGIKGNYMRVLEMMREVGDLCDFLYDHGLVKPAMELRGLAGGPSRPPLLSRVTEEQKEKLKGFMKKYGVL